jgi:phosphate transport system protein
MIEPGHTIKHYDQELRALKDMLLRMGYHADQMIADAVRSLVERRSDVAHQVIAHDDFLDCLELDVDRLCNEILALQHPVACDLRLVTAALRIVRDIERIGDIAVNIARCAIELLQQPHVLDLMTLPTMGQLSRGILSRSLDALVNSDEVAAARVIEEDRAIDDMNDQTYHDMLISMMEHPSNIQSALRLILIAKHLERIGDHATNIAEMVVFMKKGQDLRRSAPSTA